MFEFVGGFVVGIVTLVGYGAYRAINSEGWDDSNVLNWFRLLSHCFIHPEDFGQMYYLNENEIEYLIDEGFNPQQPFGYISKDEFSENFPYSRLQ